MCISEKDIKNWYKTPSILLSHFSTWFKRKRYKYLWLRFASDDDRHFVCCCVIDRINPRTRIYYRYKNILNSLGYAYLLYPLSFDTLVESVLQNEKQVFPFNTIDINLIDNYCWESQRRSSGLRGPRHLR